VYDDTNPFRHDLVNETRIMKECSVGHKIGIEYMAVHAGIWRKIVLPSPIKIMSYWAELYSGEYEVYDYFDAWTQNVSLGSPMINIGRGPNNTFLSQAIANVCRHLGNDKPAGASLGIYTDTPLNVSSGLIPMLVEALNNCTTAKVF
jgi:hypothetical protein